MSAIAYPQHPHYHGWGPYPDPGAHGFCHSCCHPASKCVCGWRECRKEAKELLVTPTREKLRDGELQSIRDAYRDSPLLKYETGFRGEQGGEPQSEKGTQETTGTEEQMREVAGKGIHLRPGLGLELRDRATAFIGGSCCVHLSVEYTSTSPSAVVMVHVKDAEGTVMSWAKENIQPGYYIKEGIISTNPGAQLGALVHDAVARVRWCEVFSC